MSKYNEVYKAIFNEERKQETYSLQPHSFHFNKRIGKQVCKSCGLVMLRNRFSDWSVQKGCLSELHSDYQRMRKSTGF